ncbi:MAG: formate dehydrogenase accessory protein FdhE [Candidatus Bathyarchaeota archaeon]|nr:formate dehydrogenase accessory protein FdhE [Candidatus Bathyarchaeota archaeon]
MGNLSVQERLKIISELWKQRGDLRDSLKLHRRILDIQLPIERSHTKGTKIVWDNQAVVDLQRRSLVAKEPIVHFIDPSVFDLDVLFPMTQEIVYLLTERSTTQGCLGELLSSMENGKMSLHNLIKATLEENVASIRKAAERLDVDPPLLLFVLSTLIQPSLEEIARKTDSSLLDKWWQTSCPVCGRVPAVARIRHRKRYLQCTFCGTEYLSDRFLCAHCGNKDPYTLKYLTPEAQSALQIDYCEKCRHYIKVIYEARLRESVPKGLEDILTLNLDFAAKKAGLKRN